MTPAEQAAHIEAVNKRYASKRDTAGRFAVGWASVAYHVEYVLLGAAADLKAKHGIEAQPIDAEGGVIFADATLEFDGGLCCVYDDCEHPDDLARFSAEVRALLPADGRLRAIVFVDEARTQWQIRQVTSTGALVELSYSSRPN